MHKSMMQKIRNKTARIGVVGLGYVGLPTSVFFAEKGFDVIGCEVRASVVNAVNKGRSPLKDLNIDSRLKKVVLQGRLAATENVTMGTRKSDVVMIAVPTPTKEGFEPDLRYVVSAGKSVSKGLHKGQLVVLESTVYPGVTEGILRPILEESGLRAGIGFGLAYCPERYNPGDIEHGIDQVARVVGGIDPEWTRIAELLYGQVTKIHAVDSIQTAEMAKVIENTQRDLNIALMNEVAMICEKLGLDVVDVIRAAATKWNFNVYYPGPGVGGHCLPKDPWYLVNVAQKAGYNAQVITAGRRINDSMPLHVVQLLVKAMNDIGKPVKLSKTVILGLAYKENIGDTRNSPAIVFAREVRGMGGIVHSVDPYVDRDVAVKEFHTHAHHRNLSSVFRKADSIVLMTAHRHFENLDLVKIRRSMNRVPIFIDTRRVYRPEHVRQSGFIYVGLGRG